MKLFFVFTGKTSEKAIAGLLADYKNRISRYVTVDAHEIKVSNEKNESIPGIKDKEQKEQLKQISERDFLVLLDEKGKEISSVEFAVQLEKWFSASGKRLVFMTGGAYGFGDGILKRANVKLSFSKFTFTHQFIRVLLLEQVYRAFTIINNQKYHH
ncbi:MAG TPA: 23S rRNA (pseudouridine(1915)-N(3))-methyltransferase RlmH [Bacteroidia bacterium]|nr:23S rRNA (pseudouridine(1915)-N(3))-methyltransferase RlmH [Bacteroidia bacterium]